MPGLLALNGGAEFQPGNEPQDERLAAAAGRGPAYVLPTAAARQHPELAVARATDWFAGLGLQVLELPVLGRRDAGSERLAELAAGAGLFYLVGGDPGLVVAALRDSPVWAAMVAAWRGGAALAGSSAGAMALCSHSLVLARWPRHDRRRAAPALGLLPGVAVLPHHDTFGHRWSVVEAPEGLVLLGLDERTAALWDGRAWTAAGAGAVTVVAGGGSRRFGAGEEVLGIPPPDPGQA